MKIGDLVVLKSGSCDLEVIDFSPTGNAIVKWTPDDKFKSEIRDVPQACLLVSKTTPPDTISDEVYFWACLEGMRREKEITGKAPSAGYVPLSMFEGVATQLPRSNPCR